MFRKEGGSWWLGCPPALPISLYPKIHPAVELSLNWTIGEGSFHGIKSSRTRVLKSSSSPSDLPRGLGQAPLPSLSPPDRPHTLHELSPRSPELPWGSWSREEG